MSTTVENDNDGDTDLKGKDFDTVCDLVKDEEVAGAVHKRPDGGGAGRWSYCFSFTPNEYNEAELLDLIAAEYGPGSYPVQFKSAKKGKPPSIRWHKDMVVQARRHRAQQSPPAATPESSSSDALVAALAGIADGQTRILEALNRQPTLPPQKTTIEIAQELAVLKDLFTDGKQTVLEQVKDVLELKQMLSDSDDGPIDPMAAALKYLGPAIEKGLEGQAAAAARPAAAPPPPPPPPPGVDTELAPADDAAKVAPTGTWDDELHVNQAFDFFAGRYLGTAMQLANAGRDPAEVGVWLARLVGSDEGVREMVGLVVSQDDMIERLARYDDAVAGYTAWFDLVADHVAHALWPDNNPAPGAENATIDTKKPASTDDGVITDAGTDEHDQAEATGSAEARPDAESIDAPRTGNDHDP